MRRSVFAAMLTGSLLSQMPFMGYNEFVCY